MTPALEISGLTVEFPAFGAPPFVAVRDLSLTVAPGEIHALVGESGAGKSTVGNCVLGLLEAPGRIAGGTISVAGRPLGPTAGREAGTRPGRDIGAIFQDPMTSLNPLFTIEAQLVETMRHHLRLGPAAARARALELLRAVEIPEPERRLKQYPHQLSGGQRQRVVIAAALSCGPDLLIADELMAAGVTVGLGSDATAPDRSADMFRHMQQAMHYHRRHFRDPSWLPPGKVLEMCTIDGARALGMEDDIGSLEVGKKADLILVDMRRPHLYPANMHVSHVVNFANGNDVRDVICDGRILMRDRRVLTVDEDAVLDAAQRETDLMLDRGGLRWQLDTPDTFWGALQMNAGTD